jgi:hypothetical protein
MGVVMEAQAKVDARVMARNATETQTRDKIASSATMLPQITTLIDPRQIVAAELWNDELVVPPVQFRVATPPPYADP